jgi:hypothetical protein
MVIRQDTKDKFKTKGKEVPNFKMMKFEKILKWILDQDPKDKTYY